MTDCLHQGEHHLKLLEPHQHCIRRIGLFSVAVIFDILFLVSGNPAFPTVSYYILAAGVVGGLLAAIFGFIDWPALPANSRAKRIGGWHGLGNFIIVVLLAVSWLIRGEAANFVPNRGCFRNDTRYPASSQMYPPLETSVERI